MRFDHYSVLGVEVTATDEDIHRAHRFLARAFHPDRWVGESAQTIAQANYYISLVNTAKEMLLKPAERAEYDRRRTAEAVPTDPVTGVFAEPLQNVPAVWKALASWLKVENQATPASRHFAFQVGDYLERRRALSEKQQTWAQCIWADAVRGGFDPAVALAGGYNA